MHVAVHVGSGDDEKAWHLPEKLLKSQSTFFTAALVGSFAEGISKSITLPEDNPDIFKYFVEWLYVGGDRFAAFDSSSLVCLWILGDRLGCPVMQDDAMCDLIKHHGYFQISEVTLNRIYEGSAPGSKLRQFAVDQCLLDVRYSAPRHKSYSRFVKDNEDFAQQLAEATIFLGREEPKNPYNDKSRYLCAPSSGQPPPKSGS